MYKEEKDYIDKYMISDVKGEFDDEVYEHRDFDIATKKILESYAPALSDDYESCEVMLGLALSQWKYGVLTEEVRDITIDEIEKKIICLNKASNHKDIDYLNKQLLKLNSINPKPKKFPKYKGPFYKCKWNIGDVYAYHFTNTDTNEQAYMYMVKIGESPMLKNLYPSVYLFDIVSEELLSLQDVIKVPYMVMSDFSNSSDQNKTKKYAILVAASFENEVPFVKLTFLGNIEKVERVKNEANGAYLFDWKDLDPTFTFQFKVRGVNIKGFEQTQKDGKRI